MIRGPAGKGGALEAPPSPPVSFPHAIVYIGEPRPVWESPQSASVTLFRPICHCSRHARGGIMPPTGTKDLCCACRREKNMQFDWIKDRITTMLTALCATALLVTAFGCGGGGGNPGGT